MVKYISILSIFPKDGWCSWTQEHLNQYGVGFEVDNDARTTD